MSDEMLAEYLLDQEAREREAKEAAEVHAWVLGVYGCPNPPSGHFGPADLQRVFRSLSWNRACSILEAMERNGDIERVIGHGSTFRLAPKAANPTRAGVELHLSPKEHGALLRCLDWYLAGGPAAARPNECPTLRAIRNKLKRPA